MIISNYKDNILYHFLLIFFFSTQQISLEPKYKILLIILLKRILNRNKTNQEKKNQQRKLNFG